MAVDQKPKKGGRLAAVLIILGVGAAVEVAHQPPATPMSDADKLSTARRAEDDATAVTGEAAIREILKDPQTATFGSTSGRLRHGVHVACGSVNAKNSFGGFTGEQPWLVLVEKKVAMIADGGQAGRFAKLWNDYCVGTDDRAPKVPAEFLGIRLGHRPTVDLRPLDGSGSVWVYRQNRPTSYLGVPITDAWFEAEHGRIFGGEATAKGGVAYDQWRAALEKQFGPATSWDAADRAQLKWEAGDHEPIAELYHNEKTDQVTTSIHIE